MLGKLRKNYRLSENWGVKNAYSARRKTYVKTTRNNRR
jgi:hypothetical protein